MGHGSLPHVHAACSAVYLLPPHCAVRAPASLLWDMAPFPMCTLPAPLCTYRHYIAPCVRQARRHRAWAGPVPAIGAYAAHRRARRRAHTFTATRSGSCATAVHMRSWANRCLVCAHRTHVMLGRAACRP